MADNGRAITITEVVYHYVPNKIPAGIAAGVFFVVSLILFRHTFKMRSWWSLCLPIGAMFYALGFILRIVLSVNEANLDSLILFILTQLIIICAPAAFLAFNYILYGRLLDGRVSPEFSIMRPSIVSRVFIISDVTTFLLQASGGGITAIERMASAGKTLMIFGLSAQLASYVVFWIMFAILHIRAHRAGDLRTKQPWHKIIWVLHFSSVCVLIRCIFRTAEWSVPADHALITKEWVFYVLDVVTLFFGIGIYCIFWPAKHIANSTDGRVQWNKTDQEMKPQGIDSRENRRSAFGRGRHTHNRVS
ncbi:RTA1 like protein-domain-containing protein [Pterulicium gracile]|uniref:RTA1 like protein-domain-containing protein n=1 Tax=Pterulicium gracile TaxID=1884261 RepID=A0A5C3QBN6_9AGAR|nr:RTA1 like protein-domain-containing protein [Pterula gracilis]